MFHVLFERTPLLALGRQALANYPDEGDLFFTPTEAILAVLAAAMAEGMSDQSELIATAATYARTTPEKVRRLLFAFAGDDASRHPWRSKGGRQFELLLNH